MTTTTPETVLLPAPDTPDVARPSTRLRFAVAFLVGLLAAMALGVGALYAYDRQYIGRILPGVAIGSLDLSGHDPATAAAAIREVYGYLGEGSVTFATPDSERTISFADIGRGPDVDAMVAEALAVGRDGNAVGSAHRGRADRVPGRIADTQGHVRCRCPGRACARLRRHAGARAARRLGRAWSPGSSRSSSSVDGRLADPATPVEAALADLGEIDAPADLRYEMPVRAITPTVTTDEANKAKADAERIAAPILFAGRAEEQKITTARLRSWLSFAPTADGGYGVSIDTSGLEDLSSRASRRRSTRHPSTRRSRRAARGSRASPRARPASRWIRRPRSCRSSSSSTRGWRGRARPRSSRRSRSPSLA